MAAITASQALQPGVGTDWMVGLSTVASSETTTAVGTVSVQPVTSQDIFLCAPKTASAWNTQAKYNLLVGARTVFDVTSGAITVLTPTQTASLPTRGATRGLVVRPLNITQTPGQVAFSFKDGLNPLNNTTG